MSIVLYCCFFRSSGGHVTLYDHYGVRPYPRLGIRYHLYMCSMLVSPFMLLTESRDNRKDN